ncbi:hypothetical protein Gotur_019251 [Gossypium turneri]
MQRPRFELPEVLVMGILSKLPVKSLTRFNCVSPPFMVLVMDYCVYLILQRIRLPFGTHQPESLKSFRHLQSNALQIFPHSKKPTLL